MGSTCKGCALAVPSGVVPGAFTLALGTHPGTLDLQVQCIELPLCNHCFSHTTVLGYILVSEKYR